MRAISMFKQLHQDAMDTIQHYLFVPEMQELVDWLLTTDANPYGFLPVGWQDSYTSAVHFASLLNNIHHAVVDDGEMIFVSVQGEPRILFVDRWATDIRTLAMTQAEQVNDTRRAEHGLSRYSVEILDITANEFGKHYDAYYVAQIKRWFLRDTRKYLVEAMEDVYSSGILTGIAHEWQAYRQDSVAMQLPDGSWVGWLYSYYSARETVADGWIENSYNVVLREEEQTITVQTFTRGN